MHDFETCYKKTRRQLTNFDFHAKLPKSMAKFNLASAMDSDGPNRRGYDDIKALRAALTDSKRKTNKSEGEILVAACEDVAGKTIIGKITGWLYDTKDRVSAVKMMRHMYLMRMRGSQDVWVYSPPKSYTQWLYDEFEGMNKAGLETWSSEDDETYSESDKTAMADATQMAMAWCMKCQVKLSTPDAASKALVRKWFCAPGADDKAVEKASKTLGLGFKKICSVLNSNKLVLSDEPNDRAGGGWKDYAFVYKSEKMSVVYVQSATLSAAKGSKMWLAALTIVHELSHREMNTEDHRYDSDGKLSPSAGQGALSAAHAIQNADNWGYFAADMNGGLAGGTSLTVAGVA
ncbi:MAG: M35 family metallo-endopeptidase [Gemmobacter sp.]|nr:M35 family metallo-endopeptidase [Gemmobacter sp.]